MRICTILSLSNIYVHFWNVAYGIVSSSSQGLSAFCTCSLGKLDVCFVNKVDAISVFQAGKEIRRSSVTKDVTAPLRSVSPGIALCVCNPCRCNLNVPKGEMRPGIPSGWMPTGDMTKSLRLEELELYFLVAIYAVAKQYRPLRSIRGTLEATKFRNFWLAGVWMRTCQNHQQMELYFAVAIHGVEVSPFHSWNKTRPFRKSVWR